jgi:hypothetical protein
LARRVSPLPSTDLASGDGLPCEASPSVSLSHLPPYPPPGEGGRLRSVFACAVKIEGQTGSDTSSLSLWERETEGEVSEGTAFEQQDVNKRVAEGVGEICHQQICCRQFCFQTETSSAAILENLFEISGIGGGEEESAHGLIKCVACRFWRGAAAHDVERHGMSHVLASFFPDVDGRLQVHAVILAGCMPWQLAAQFHPSSS